MSLAIPDGHVLIRMWSQNFEPAGWALAPFDHGFEIPADHPAFDTLCGMNPRINVVTVEATHEYCWRIKTIHIDPSRSRLQVRCIPWIDGLRACIVSDEWFLENVARDPGGDAA